MDDRRTFVESSSQTANDSCASAGIGWRTGSGLWTAVLDREPEVAPPAASSTLQVGGVTGPVRVSRMRRLQRR